VESPGWDLITWRSLLGRSWRIRGFRPWPRKEENPSTRVHHFECACPLAAAILGVLGGGEIAKGHWTVGWSRWGGGTEGLGGVVLSEGE